MHENMNQQGHKLAFSIYKVDNCIIRLLNDQASITLADCLACSGCITSAETILIEQQSNKQILEIFRLLALIISMFLN